MNLTFLSIGRWLFRTPSIQSVTRAVPSTGRRDAAKAAYYLLSNKILIPCIEEWKTPEIRRIWCFGRIYPVQSVTDRCRKRPLNVSARRSPRAGQRAGTYRMLPTAAVKRSFFTRSSPSGRRSEHPVLSPTTNSIMKRRRGCRR